MGMSRMPAAGAMWRALRSPATGALALILGLVLQTAAAQGVANARPGADDSAAASTSSGAGAVGGSTFVQPVIRATPVAVSPAQSASTSSPASNARATKAAAGDELASPDSLLKPLPLNDFQRFAEDATGQRLPLFGFSLFEQAEGAYAPSLNVPVSPDYRLGPGDELMIHGWGAIVVDLMATVDRNGQIHIPRVGPVTLVGVQASQAESVIRTAISRYYKDFQLSVTPGRLRGINVYVVGQARKPGAYALPSTATLVSALFASGGPNQNGSMRHIQVKRGGQLVTEIDLYAFLARGDKVSDVRLQDGDTIVIPAATAYVAIAGRVSGAAVFELLGTEESIGALLEVAGGVSVVADPTRVQLERIDPARRPSRSVEVLALDAAGRAHPLRNGDILTVAPLVPDFGQTVTLRGNVTQPVRSPWKAGMTVQDLIPGRSFLMSRASVRRQNKVFRADADDSGNASRLSGEALALQIGDLIDEVNFDYAVIERVDSNKLVVNLLPFNLGAALDDPASKDNLSLQPGDVLTVFSVKDVQVPQSKRQVFVRVEGEVKRPGVYQMNKGETLQDLMSKAGGPTTDAYLFGLAFYREAVRKAQADSLKQLVRKLEAQVETSLSNAAASSSSSDSAAQVRVQVEAQAQKAALERLKNFQPTGRVMLGLTPTIVADNALPQVHLEPQDRVVVPPRPDFITVLGAVNSETAMLWKSGLTVEDYLELSGVTSGADQDEVFVIRANGSVLSNTSSWFGRVKRAEALPGDVIVMPEKTDHESAWSAFTRNAKDITQIIYQFSLGAAAIKTLRQ
jgi:protein involved in polysaccharide export with SLBB domain